MSTQKDRGKVFAFSFTAFVAFLGIAIPTWIQTMNHIAALILFAVSGVFFLISGCSGYSWLRHRKDDALTTTAAVLELSEPELIPRQHTGYSYGGQAPTADLYRIKVTNKGNAQALNVKASITESQPHLDSLPMAFHRTHDNVPSQNKEVRYEQSWTLRPDETLSLDVIGMDTDRKSLYLWRSDIGAQQMIYRIPSDKVPEPEHMRKEGFVFTISIRADSPTTGIDQDYRAFVDEENHFRLDPITQQNDGTRKRIDIPSSRKQLIAGKQPKNEHDSLMKSLNKAKVGAESLQKLRPNTDISDEWTDGWGEMVEIGHQFKNAIAGLNELLPNPRSEADAKINELIRSLERGMALILVHKRRHDLSAFKAEIDANCEEIKIQIDDIWKYII